MPIRTLTPRHRQRIAAHLLKLSPRDRYLRFGYAAADAQIQHYVDTLDFRRDALLGVFNRGLELVAVCHLAYMPPPAEGAPRMAELGVSVLPHTRGRGYGRRLFDRAALHARNQGVTALFIQALTENDAMLHIARSAGAQVVRDGMESDARLELPAENLGSRMEEAMAHGVAELNYRIKVQARRFHGLMKAWANKRAASRKNVKVQKKGPGAP